ncbi:MAG: DUF262 domain-containing protein [Deltaproteobacteria bacterium]|nr:DUF262 domain-containing protein [Deltaproteobacteria bacterium]
MPKALPRPIAETKSVTDLVRLVMSGRVRIPVYARDLQWTADDVLTLFDSIYRGYPIGALVFHKHPAPAKKFELGPLVIHASEEASALNVMDGQQRLAALAASLMRPLPIPIRPEDPYVVYFDPREEQFCSPPREGDIPDTWVPLPYLADSSQLIMWAHNWAHGRDELLVRTLFEAATRIREYNIPTYTVEVDAADSELLGAIFHRVNASGRPPKWSDIYNALYGGQESVDKPSTLPELSDALAALGMGQLDQQDLLLCLIAFEGKDLTQSLDVHLRQAPEFLAGTAARALPTMRAMLSFLRVHAKIVHQRLLPRTAPLPILARFFRYHPDPKPRSLELLTRWTWRSFFATKSSDQRAFQQRGVLEIDDDEEQSVQRLLALLPRTEPHPLALTKTFDPRAAESRIALLGMVSLSPRALENAQPLDVAAMIEQSDRKAFRKILGHHGDLASSPANRIILPGTGIARSELLAHIEASQYADVVLRSHAISGKGSEALLSGDYERFLALREQTLTDVTIAFARRLAGWSRPDRPSIDYILESTTESAE